MPIHDSLRTVCELFTNELAKVQFPDVDAAALNLAADRVTEQEAAVARAEALLSAAREQLQDSQDALLHKAQRALSYAQVFAQEDAVLSARLAQISLPRSSRRARTEAPLIADAAVTPKKRGRPAKIRNDSTELFQADAQLAAL